MVPLSFRSIIRQLSGNRFYHCLKPYAAIFLSRAQKAIDTEVKVGHLCKVGVMWDFTTKRRAVSSRSNLPQPIYTLLQHPTVRHPLCHRICQPLHLPHNLVYQSDPQLPDRHFFRTIDASVAVRPTPRHQPPSRRKMG
jgi:hypothetical protein